MKLYKVNLFQRFSELRLPWTITQDDGEVVPLRLEDAPADGPHAIGFLPVFGSQEAADAFAKGRWSIDEITLKPPSPPFNPVGQARVVVPTPDAQSAEEPQKQPIRNVRKK